MAEDPLQELAQHNKALSELMKLIPTIPLTQFEESLNAVSLAYRKTRKETEEFADSLSDLTRESVVSRSELAKGAAAYAQTINATSLSVDKYLRISMEAAKVDPINATRRIEQVRQLTAQYGSLVSGLDTSTNAQTRQATAMRLAAIEMSKGNKEMANFLVTMAEGREQMGTFAEKQALLAKRFSENKLAVGQFIGESKSLGGVLSILTTTTGSWLATLGLTVVGIVKAKDAYTGLKQILSNLSGAGGGGGGGGVPAGGGGLAPLQGWNGFVAGGKANMATGVGRRLGVSGAVGLGVAGYNYYNATSDDERRNAVAGGIGSTVGGMAGASLGSFLGPVGTLIGGVFGGIAGEKLGLLLAGKVSSVFNKKIDTSLVDRSEAITGAQTRIKGTLEGYDIGGQQQRAMAAQSGLVGQLSGMGAIGPGAGMNLALAKIKYGQDQIDLLTKAQIDFAASSANSAISVAQNSKETAIKIKEIQSQQLSEVANYRNSIIQQFTAAAVGQGNGTFTMPGGMSDRQKYGGSYSDFMSLENIGGRGQQARSQDYYNSKFAPQLGAALKSVGQGFAGGGQIPGPPSSSDNTISAVASGEYIVNASAVQHYGAGLFDSLNSKSAPRFAGGGWFDKAWNLGKAALKATTPGMNLPELSATHGNIVEALANKLSKGSGISRNVDLIDTIDDFKNNPTWGTRVHNQPERYAVPAYKNALAAQMRADNPDVNGPKAWAAMQKIAGKQVETEGAQTPYPRELMRRSKQPYDPDAGLPEVWFDRAAPKQKNFGNSMLRTGALGGKTHDNVHAFFEDGIFGGGGGASAGRGATMPRGGTTDGHPVSENTGKAQLAELKSLNKNIVGMMHNFAASAAQ